MSELHVTLSDNEQQFLGKLLQNELKETRIEEHRTRKPSYREYVVHQENVIKQILDKLGQMSH